MIKRPFSVTVVSLLMIAAGATGLAYHLREFQTERAFQYDLAWILAVRLLAIVCGVYMLRGSNWARWLTLGWIAYHVILSGFHSFLDTVMHGLLLAVWAYILFRTQANVYFRDARTEVT